MCYDKVFPIPKTFLKALSSSPWSNGFIEWARLFLICMKAFDNQLPIAISQKWFPPRIRIQPSLFLLPMNLLFAPSQILSAASTAMNTVCLMWKHAIYCSEQLTIPDLSLHHSNTYFLVFDNIMNKSF